MNQKVTIDEAVIRAENKYLTKVASWTVGTLISATLFVGGWQITVLNELVKKVDESNVANNNRFNLMENRFEVRGERGKAIVERLDQKDALLEAEDKRIWEAIKELRK